MPPGTHYTRRVAPPTNRWSQPDQRRARGQPPPTVLDAGSWRPMPPVFGQDRGLAYTVRRRSEPFASCASRLESIEAGGGTDHDAHRRRSLVRLLTLVSCGTWYGGMAAEFASCRCVIHARGFSRPRLMSWSRANQTRLVRATTSAWHCRVMRWIRRGNAHG